LTAKKTQKAKLPNFSCKSKEELLFFLGSIDISVSPRGVGRTNAQVERWSICRLLATLAHSDLLAYPIELDPEVIERPDFALRMQGICVGVEVTEAIYQKYAEATAIANREHPGHYMLELGLFAQNSQIGQEEIRAAINTDRLKSPGWEGETAEKEWVGGISTSIQNKLKLLGNPDFKKLQLNWLSVYGNLPLPSINVSMASQYLRAASDEFWNCAPVFDEIFVEQGSSICRLTKAGCEILQIPELWTVHGKQAKGGQSAACPTG
jgi:hypothetical protein